MVYFCFYRRLEREERQPFFINTIQLKRSPDYMRDQPEEEADPC